MPNLSSILTHHIPFNHFSPLSVVFCFIQSLFLSCSIQPLPFTFTPVLLHSTRSYPSPIYSILSFPFSFLPVLFHSIHSHPSPSIPFNLLPSHFFPSYFIPSILTPPLPIPFYHFPSLSFCVPSYSVPSLSHPSFPFPLFPILSRATLCHPFLPLPFFLHSIFSLHFPFAFLPIQSRPFPFFPLSAFPVLSCHFPSFPIPSFLSPSRPILSRSALPSVVICIPVLFRHVPSQSQYFLLLCSFTPQSRTLLVLSRTISP